MFTSRTLLRAIGLAVAAFVFSPDANAAVYTYDLGDHPKRGEQDLAYGLRLDIVDLYWSFEGASTAQMVYDSDALTASIFGTAILNPVAGPAPGGEAWTVNYDLIGITDIGNGLFWATGGVGTFGNGTTEYELTGKQNMEGVAFLMYTLFREYDDYVTGTGWVMVDGEYEASSDFLFTVKPATVPLPLPIAMLLTAVGGIALIGRRRRAD